MELTICKDQSFDEERALYGSDGIVVENCSFDGPIDGESALKESRNIEVISSFFNLRYPFWHAKNVVVRNSVISVSEVSQIIMDDPTAKGKVKVENKAECA